MKEKTKIMSIGDRNYQIRRFTPDVGSFILMQLLSASIKGVSPEQLAAIPDETPQAQEAPVDDKVRGLALAAFHGMDFEMHQFIQRKCLAVCSRMEGPNADQPMPLASNGTVSALIADDVQLVMRLEVEALAFNLADFFEQGGLAALRPEAVRKA